MPSIKSQDFAEAAGVDAAGSAGRAINGAQEAAQAQQANLELAKDAAKGANVHSFNPDARPEDKARQLMKDAKASVAPVDMSAAPSLKPDELKSFEASGGAAVASDIDNKKTVKPTTDLKEVEKLSQAAKSDAPEPPTVPGAMPDGKAREIPDWFKIGWTGQDKIFFETPEDAKQKTILTEFLSDAYFGQWYHNAAVIVFAVLATHFVTLFGGGIGWLIVILAFTATYYQTSEKRTRRNFRDDITREVAKKGLKADVESASWLNHFLQRFWLIYEPVLSATIVASVDQVLSVSTPAFLDSMRLTTFTLGTKPPHIDHVRTFPDTEEDIIMMEWKISFLPNDVKDMTYAAAARKVNPKIVLNIRFGVGPASVGKDIIVEDIAFSGTMRVKIKLMNNFPHAQTVDLSFNQPPHFDFVAKPIGFDLSIIPGLIPFIHNQVHATLGPMMYAPNTFTLNLEQMLSGAPIDTAIGVLAVSVRNGRGLKATKLGGGAPDPYVSLSIAGRAELAKTKIKKSTATPGWNETKFILLNSLNDPLTLTVKDWNEHRPDSDLGAVNFDLKTLAEDAEQPGQTGEILLEGKPRGQLRFDVAFFPVLKPTKLADGTEEPVPETTTGIVRLVVHQAKELDPRGQQINPYFNVLLNDAQIHRSQTLKRSPNPIWERPTEFLVTDKSRAVVGIQVLDDNSMTADSRLGYVKVRLTDILAANAKQQDWFPLSSAKSGRLRISASWKPVLMAGAISGAGSYTPPIGVIRLWLKRGRDLKNVEGLTGGKSDPYARIWRAGIVAARSHIINNNLDPDWDEFIYVPIHNPRDSLSLEVLDYQHMTKDRSLGQCELDVSSLLKEGSDKKRAPWLSTGRVTRKEMLKSDGKRTVKGSVEFDIEFVPCAHLKNVSFEAPKQEVIKEESDVESVKTGTTNGESGRLSVDTTKEKKKEEEEEGITMTRAELLKAQSGILAVQIISGQLARKGARLEVLFDDGYWPAYSTEAARSAHNTWDEIGEAMIRQLDFSRIILKLNTAEKDTREDVYASASFDMNEFLEKCLDTPATFTLSDAAGGSRSTVTLCCKYIPVDIELDLREKIENSGNLRVELLDAKGLRGADRSGKSDPYAVFELNGTRVYKSEVQKKTLSPTWNEKFECQVPSRVAANFVVEVFDWDRVGTADKLGKARIDLTQLEPIESKEMTLALTDKTGSEHGSVRIRMVFRPAFLARSRQATSTFSSAGRAVGGTVIGAGGAVLGAGGTVIGAGAHGVGAVGKAGLHGVGTVGKIGVGGVGLVGSGVGAVGKGLVGGVKRVGGRGANGQQEMILSESPSMNSMLDNSMVSAADAEILADQSLVSQAGAGLPGTLSVTVVQLSGAGEQDDKKLVTIKSGGKTVGHTHPQKGDPAIYNETFHVKTSEGPCDLDLVVAHKKTLGSDKTLGSSTVNAWDHINPLSMPSANIQAPLLGTGGSVQLALTWSGAAGDDARSVTGSIAQSTKSKKSPFSKFTRSPSHRHSMVAE